MAVRKRRVYILEVRLKEETVYKIGITGRALKKRIFEIADSFYDSHGFIPTISVLRGSEKSHRVHGFFRVEAELLAIFKSQSIEWSKKFDGSSEFRRCNGEVLLQEYDRCIVEFANTTEEPCELADTLEQVQTAFKNEGRLDDGIEAVFVELDAQK